MPFKLKALTTTGWRAVRIGFITMAAVSVHSAEAHAFPSAGAEPTEPAPVTVFTTTPTFAQSPDKCSQEWPKPFSALPFLDEKIGTETGVVILESGVKYIVIENGEGDRPEETEYVKIRQRTSFYDSENEQWNTGVFSLSTGQVMGYIDGYSDGLELMRPGAKYVFYVPEQASHAETRIIEVELLEVSATDVESADSEDDAYDTREEESSFDEATFLAENGRRKGVVTLPSGLQYKVFAKGRGQSPNRHDEVFINYCSEPLEEYVPGCEGKGDFSRDCDPISHYIDGLQEGLQLMRPGARYVFWIPGSICKTQQGRFIQVELLSVYRAPNSW